MVQISADHFASVIGAEPQRANNFSANINAVPETEFYVSGVSFPKYQAQVSELRQGNLFKKFVTGVKYNDIALSLYAMVEIDVAISIEKWWKRITKDSGETIEPALNYKEEGTLVWLDGCGGNPKVWRIIGVFPSDVDFGTGNMQGGGLVEIQLTLSVDQIMREPA